MATAKKTTARKSTAKKSTARKSTAKAKPGTIPAKKHCAGCDRNRSASSFHKNKKSADGLQTYCKDCVRDKYGSRGRKAS